VHFVHLQNMDNTKAKGHFGFTLIQTVIVIVILGALAGMAVPRMMTIIYKVRNQEALPILISLLGAQFEYKRVAGNYTEVFDDLDITVPSESELKNFTAIIVYDSSTLYDCGSGDHRKIASMNALSARSDTAPRPYTLFILEDGRICCNLIDSSYGGICSRMGFNR